MPPHIPASSSDCGHSILQCCSCWRVRTYTGRGTAKHWLLVFHTTRVASGDISYSWYLIGCASLNVSDNQGQSLNIITLSGASGEGVVVTPRWAPPLSTQGNQGTGWELASMKRLQQWTTGRLVQARFFKQGSFCQNTTHNSHKVTGHLSSSAKKENASFQTIRSFIKTLFWHHVPHMWFVPCDSVRPNHTALFSTEESAMTTLAWDSHPSSVAKDVSLLLTCVRWHPASSVKILTCQIASASFAKLNLAKNINIHVKMSCV